MPIQVGDTVYWFAGGELLKGTVKMIGHDIRGKSSVTMYDVHPVGKLGWVRISEYSIVKFERNEQ